MSRAAWREGVTRLFALMQVHYPVGASMDYLTLHTRFSPVFGSKLFIDCSLSGDRGPEDAATVAVATKSYGLFTDNFSGERRVVRHDSLGDDDKPTRRRCLAVELAAPVDGRRTLHH